MRLFLYGKKYRVLDTRWRSPEHVTRDRKSVV